MEGHGNTRTHRGGCEQEKIQTCLTIYFRVDLTHPSVKYSARQENLSLSESTVVSSQSTCPVCFCSTVDRSTEVHADSPERLRQAGKQRCQRLIEANKYKQGTWALTRELCPDSEPLWSQ